MIDVTVILSEIWQIKYTVNNNTHTYCVRLKNFYSDIIIFQNVALKITFCCQWNFDFNGIQCVNNTIPLW